MNILRILPWFFLLCLYQVNAQPSQKTIKVNINADSIINTNYLGNGFQWDPYQLDYGDTVLEISGKDWKKLYNRLDFMKPQLIRVMINSENFVESGKIKHSEKLDQVLRILSYCQKNGVRVLFGDWGGGIVDPEKGTINKDEIGKAVKLLSFLVIENSFSCIQNYNLINEPNGFWSSTHGKYGLWASAMEYFHKEMASSGLDQRLSLVGPDAAIWSAKETWWVDSCATLDAGIGLYDIHTYPSKSTVNSDKYSKIIQAYKERVPGSTPIVMGEIGFKYITAEDSLLKQRNIERATAKPFASVEDSQMSVYDYSYGTDMADALFQTVNAGYSGSIVWMLDDAMHSKEAPNKLKVWGFWNILGDEYFGADEEVVRPWYYAWSLLTRYMPQGSHILFTQTTPHEGIKVIGLEKDGHYMIALVNVSNKSKAIELTGQDIPVLSSVKKFLYAQNTLIKKQDHIILPNDTIQLDFSTKSLFSLPAGSLLVLTNFNY